MSLESLADGINAITEDAVGFYKENCIRCFSYHNHKSGVELVVQDRNEELTCQVHWTGKISERIEKSYRDLKRAVDHASCAIALLLIRELTEYTADSQAASDGTTIDYYLVSQKNDNPLIFNTEYAAYLEVSGILSENKKNPVKKRYKEKVDRLDTEEDLPVFIIIVEFSNPWTKIYYEQCSGTA